MTPPVSIAGRLAAFYAGLDPADLPPETIHAVRRHMLDTFGAALAGAQQPEHDDSVPSNIATRVTVTGAAGEAETMRIDVPQGSWDRPLPDSAVTAKFLGLAGPVLGASRAARLADAVMVLGQGAGLESFTDMLRPAGSGEETP